MDQRPGVGPDFWLGLSVALALTTFMGACLWLGIAVARALP